MLAAALLTGILLIEAVLLAVYVRSLNTDTEAALKKNAEIRRFGTEHLLEQLEAEIEFAIRQDTEESLKAARQRVESFAEAVSEVRTTADKTDDTDFFEYLRTVNRTASHSYVYVLENSGEPAEHPLMEKLKRIMPQAEVSRVRNIMSEMPLGSSAVISYKVFNEAGSLIEKTGYIKKIWPDGTIIGSGFCNEKNRENIQEYIISQLESLTGEENPLAYFAVIDHSGAGSRIVGAGGMISTDPLYADKLISRLGGAKTSFYYEITEDGYNGHNLRPAVVRNISAWDWTVAAGPNEKDKNAAEAAVLRDIKMRFYIKAALSAGVSALLIIAVLKVTASGRRRFQESFENRRRMAAEKAEELKREGKRLSDEYAYAVHTEKRLAALRANLEKTVDKRIKDLHEISAHLRRENLKISAVNDELIAARKKATEASLVKSEFLANMSHEIRTPIHAILSYSSFGLKKFEGVKDLRQQGYFGKITESSGRLLSFINDLVDLADLESGRMKYKITRCCAAEIVKNAVKELERTFLEKKITVTVPENSTMICGDTARLRQVFLNIYSNAAKFSPPDSRIITEIASGGSFLKITVTDFGPGVDESEKLLIFEKFTQSSNTKTGAGGIGLGLAICREIINDHGGRIYVADNPEGGSCFSVELPLF